MAFDFKKEYKEFYRPAKKPAIIEIPPMNFLAVRGMGDPNDSAGEYSTALSTLYALAYTLKMSYRGPHQIKGFFEYVVPPLEGLWWQNGIKGVDYSKKKDFHWISLIRLPDFVTRSDFECAQEEASRKKKKDFSNIEFFSYAESLCVQCMHLGPYDTEPATVSQMENFAEKHGFASDFSGGRYHHEIYLNDPRKTASEKLKTVIRHPIKKS
ncbi:GyrI-like domain-containing protein [Enterococcus hirae]|nr:GyrI-like domain-containing protein [Enterococcus hirae]